MMIRVISAFLVLAAGFWFTATIGLLVDSLSEWPIALLLASLGCSIVSMLLMVCTAVKEEP